MSSPNAVGYSPSTLSNGKAAALDAAAASRKRQTPSAPVYSPNETLNQMTQEAEARQQDKYNVQKEIRAIRAQEMEKQRKEDEEREKEETSATKPAHKVQMTPITAMNTSNLAKHRLQSTNRSVEENSPTPSSTPDPDNPRELKKKLAELEEKYTKHAIYQTQFENDNQKLLFEVDILKDLIEEHEELIIELRRQFKEKSRELDYQKRTNKDLQTDFVRLKEILKQRDTLIQDSGLILYTDNEVKGGSTGKSLLNGETADNEIKSVLPAALVAPETAKLLDMLGEGTIDDKLKKLLETKQDLKEQNSRLKSELEDERLKISSLEKKLASHASKIQDNQESAQDLHEIQRQYTREINEFKMKNQRLDHENIVIKQDLQRLQTQLKYMQTNFDELEQSEQRLNKEKREAQRELAKSKNFIEKLQDEQLELSQKLAKSRNIIKEFQVERLERQLPKFIDISGTTSSSHATNTFNSCTATSVNASLEMSTSNVNSSQQETHELTERIKPAATNEPSQMTNSINTLCTDASSSPALSSNSSSASSSSTTSPTQQQSSKPSIQTDAGNVPTSQRNTSFSQIETSN